MIYLFLISAAVYLMFVTACSRCQRNDVCFKSLRMFVVALALITFLDLVMDWNGNPSRSEAFFQEDLAEPNASADSSTLNVGGILFDENRPKKLQSNRISKTSSEYRMESRSNKFQKQGRKSLVALSKDKKKLKKEMISSDKRKDLERTAQTAVFSILLRRVGK